MLGLGTARAWAVLGAVSAAHHGWPENAANFVAEGDPDGCVVGYIGIVPNSKK